MKNRRLYFLVPMLLLAIVLASCGGAPTEVTEDEGGFMLALPRITLEVDGEGNPSVADIDAETLKTLTFGQLDITGFQVPTDYVEWFDEADLQHIELVHTSDGLYVFANGKPMPHVGWSGDALKATGDVAEAFGVLDARTAGLVKLLVPFVQRTGIDLAVSFPTSGSEKIDLRDPEVSLSAVPAEDESEIMRARVHVRYDEDGVPSVLSVSSQDVGNALGADLRALELGPDMVQTMQNADIQHLTVRTAPQGLLIWANDQAMPHLAWSHDNLTNGADIYSQLYFTDEYNPAREAVKMLLPVLDNVSAEVVLLFPTAEGIEEIPIPSP